MSGWADRALLLLDNVRDFDQVEALLLSTLVLLTSRNRIVELDGVRFEMSALPSTDSVDLFVNLSGRRGEQIDRDVTGRVLALVGHLPLAVSILAARFRNQSTLELVDLEQELLSTQARLPSLQAGGWGVSAAFDLSYRALPHDLQELYPLLGAVSSITFTSASVAAILGGSTAAGRSALDLLFHAHLVEELAADRFRLHDLLREFARELASSEAAIARTRAADESLAAFYLGRLNGANQLIGRGAISGESDMFAGRREALDWCDAERPNLLGQIEAANRRGNDALVVRLVAAVAPFLRQAGPWDQAIQVQQLAVAAARRLAASEALAEALAELGMVHRYVGEYASAEAELVEATNVHGGRVAAGAAFAWNQLGIVRFMTSSYPLAEQAQRQSLDAADQAGDRLGRANALHDLGMVLRVVGDYPESVRSQQQALDDFAALGDRYGQANALRELASLEFARGDLAASFDRCGKALALYAELEDRAHQAYTLNDMAVLHRWRAHPSAESVHRQALALFQATGDRYGEARVLKDLGTLLRLADRPEEALECQTRASALFDQLGSLAGRAATLSEMAALSSTGAGVAPDVDRFSEAATLFERIGDNTGLCDTLTMWATALEAIGQRDAAAENFRRASELAHQYGLVLEEARALAGLGRGLADAGETDLARTELARAVALFHRAGLSAEVARVEALMPPAASPGATDAR